MLKINAVTERNLRSGRPRKWNSVKVQSSKHLGGINIRLVTIFDVWKCIKLVPSRLPA